MQNRSRPIRGLIAAISLLSLPGATLPGAQVSATVTGLRSGEGQVLACLTSMPSAFPKCEKDPDARSLIAPAAATVTLEFGSVPSGSYAIALVHDENANGKLDKRLIVPREGFGFSRDAPVRLGPPSFKAAAFEVDEENTHQAIRMRYMF